MSNIYLASRSGQFQGVLRAYFRRIDTVGNFSLKNFRSLTLAAQ
jgi:hypothetical protein